MRARRACGFSLFEVMVVVLAPGVIGSVAQDGARTYPPAVALAPTGAAK